MASVLFARSAQTDLLEAWTFISEDRVGQVAITLPQNSLSQQNC